MDKATINSDGYGGQKSSTYQCLVLDWPNGIYFLHLSPGISVRTKFSENRPKSKHQTLQRGLFTVLPETSRAGDTGTDGHGDRARRAHIIHCYIRYPRRPGEVLKWCKSEDHWQYFSTDYQHQTYLSLVHSSARFFRYLMGTTMWWQVTSTRYWCIPCYLCLRVIELPNCADFPSTMSPRTILSLATFGFLALNSAFSTSVTGHNVFESKILANHTLRYVNDSGICETTPGVHQVSGYLDIGKNQSMVRLYWFYKSSRRLDWGFLQWFWFFEARNSPETAPFTLWSKDSRFLMQLHSSIDVIPSIFQ